jgi:hypothetical protein
VQEGRPGCEHELRADKRAVNRRRVFRRWTAVSAIFEHPSPVIKSGFGVLDQAWCFAPCESLLDDTQPSGGFSLAILQPARLVVGLPLWHSLLRAVDA